MKRLAAIALLASCGDNLPDPSVAQSGRRLKLAWYVYEGGARELERDWYFDAALGTRCTRRLWSDGRYYCSPETNEAVFVNDTCTRALGRTLRGAGDAQRAAFFATTFTLAGAPQPLPSRLFTPGAPVLEPLRIWRRTSTGCLPADLEESYDYFELAVEIPLAQLVQLRRAEPRGSGRLAIADDVTVDGAIIPVALYDRQAASECTMVERPNADRITCVPADAPSAAYYDDAACREPVVAVEGSTAPERAVRFEIATSCWYGYRVGDVVASPPIYEDTSIACVETSAPGGSSLFGMAGEEELATIARERGAGPQRVTTIQRTDDALRVLDPLLYDAELDTDCSTDASLRCAPRTEVMVVGKGRRAYFADPQCQTPLAVAFVPSGTCDPPARYGMENDRYYEVGEVYRSPIYVLSTGDTCSGYAPPPPLVAHAVGAELDPSRFVQAELQIDP